MGWFFARTVVLEDNAEKELERLYKRFKRFDELYRAIEWLLARSCDKVESRKRVVKGVEYNLYRIEGDKVAGTPDVLVLYTYDDDEVNLIALRVIKIQSPED